VQEHKPPPFDRCVEHTVLDPAPRA